MCQRPAAGVYLPLRTVRQGENERAGDLPRSFESGVFDRRLKEVHEMAACYPNDYDPRGPLASFCGLISDEEPAWKLLMAQAGDETTALACALRLLMNRQVMAGVEALLYR